jgi:hypothetical protein
MERKSEGVNKQACGLASWLMVSISWRIGFINHSSESCIKCNLPVSIVKFSAVMENAFQAIQEYIGPVRPSTITYLPLAVWEMSMQVIENQEYFVLIR